jgi:CCR4-NOT transcription complex subunit 1
MHQDLQLNFNLIMQRAELTPEFLSMMGLAQETLKPESETTLRRIIAEAVDQSIIEILPPVVDRSVTIALITTRELVLKDFAFDYNWNRILKAADLIVQNLAGSLALVTCREPLKMQLTTNLKKCMQQKLSQVDPENLP